jgi:hypothetical protein
MNLAWSERGDTSLTALSHYKTSGLGSRAPATMNNSPNETDVPSVRKSRGQLPPLDAKDYVKSKTRMYRPVCLRALCLRN